MPTLDWLGRADDLWAHERVATRLLVEDPALGVGGAEGDANLLVQGDNMAALKALLPFYGGRVRCIYIDPPYNTGSAFQHRRQSRARDLAVADGATPPTLAGVPEGRRVDLGQH